MLVSYKKIVAVLENGRVVEMSINLKVETYSRSNLSLKKYKIVTFFPLKTPKLQNAKCIEGVTILCIISV